VGVVQEEEGEKEEEERVREREIGRGNLTKRVERSKAGRQAGR
jgi:hypothetical protein